MRKCLVTAVLGAAVLLPAAQAAAATGTAVSGPQVRSGIVKTDDVPPGYSYEGNFYWHDSCEAAGQGGIPRAWSAYLCIGDGWVFDSYNLYVKYN